MKKYIMILTLIFCLIPGVVFASDLNAKCEVVDNQLKWSWDNYSGANYYWMTIYNNQTGDVVDKMVYNNEYIQQPNGYGIYDLTVAAYDKDYNTNPPLAVSRMTFRYKKEIIIEQPPIQQPTELINPLQQQLIVPQYSFIDIENHWAKNEIQSLADKNLIPTNSEYFYPDQQITREDFVVILIKTLGYQPTTYQGQFTDVSIDNPNVSSYIQTAYDKGIIKGVTETEFAPTNSITREQIAVMFDRALKLKSIIPTTLKSLDVFKDYLTISDWAKDSVQNIYSLGLIQGKTSFENVIFDPLNNTTRAENATLILRLLEKL